MLIKMRLHILLAQNRMTQTQLSKVTGIRQPTISAYCNDEAISIKIDHIDKICNVLNCTPKDIFEYFSDQD